MRKNIRRIGRGSSRSDRHDQIDAVPSSFHLIFEARCLRCGELHIRVFTRGRSLP